MNISAVQSFGSNVTRQRANQPQQPQSQPIQNSQPSMTQTLQKTMNSLDSQGRASVSFRGETIFGPDGEDDNVYKDNLKKLMKADNMSLKGARVGATILDVFDNDDLDTILHSDEFAEGFDSLRKLSGKDFMSMSVNGVYETLTGKERKSSKDVDSLPLHIYQQVVK